jgi:bifunctional UDP-N-acetylglucosamine pyrophosphorylase/glucosamine-1-phosphate N-acetyltransferase
MKAVLMAAGKSTRTYPLTLTKPKVLLNIVDKSILQHNLEALYGLVDEVILIVGYRKEMIQAAFGDDFKGMKLTYIEQEEQLGTGHAVLQAKYLINGRFIAMNGDDIFHKDNVKECLKYKLSCLVQKVRDPSRFGVWVVDDDSRIKDFAEKSKEFVSNLVNCGLYVLDERIFNEIEQLKKSERGEYELNEALNNLAGYEDIYCVETVNYWLSIGYPWSLLEANQKILSKMKQSVIMGQVEPGVTIKGNVYIGPGTIVKSGTYIEGPSYIGKNCVIGPNAYFRPNTVIGDECLIRAEIDDSMIMKGSKAQHHSYIGDSVIGEYVNIAGGVLTSNRRHDRKNHVTIVNGKRVDTGKGFLGAFIGDHVRTGVGTIIYPGRKIWPGKHTLPGQIVEKDIMD